MPLCLESVKSRQIIPLDKAVLLFGRHPDCDVVLSQSAKISRKHCCIMNVNASCVLRDLGSTNGVHLNGQRVKRLALLKNGDQLAIGDILFKINTYTKPQGGNGTPAHGLSKKPVPDNSEQPEVPIVGGKGAVAEEKISDEPQVARRSPLDISQELPIAIPEEDAEFGVARSDPAFRAVADHGMPLLDEDDDGIVAASDDSQVDVILLEPLDDDDDE